MIRCRHYLALILGLVFAVPLFAADVEALFKGKTHQDRKPLGGKAKHVSTPRFPAHPI